MIEAQTYYDLWQQSKFGNVLPINLNDALSKLMEVNDAVEDGDKTDEMLAQDVEGQYE